VRTTRFWNNLRQVPQGQKIGEANTMKVFVSKDTEGPKQDSQNWLRSPVSEGGTFVLIIIT
jgi:hypothetical protein